MLERWWKRKPVPLTGAPPVRRLKSYSAQSGYVYQYVYCGQRTARDAAEFVFDASGDRKTYHPVSVFVHYQAVAVWEDAHGRALVANERYAIAKMALFQAFDERSDPASMHAPIHVDAAAVEATMRMLGLE